MSKQKTAVDYLVEKMSEFVGKSFENVFAEEIQQAKELEKKQIIDAYEQCNEDDASLSNLSYEYENSEMTESEYIEKRLLINQNGEQYYNETFEQ